MITIEDGRSELAKRNSGTLKKPTSALTVGQLEAALLYRWPREDAEEWDRTGLIVGDPTALVTGVAVALDPTKKAILAAKKAGANVLLTHHPPFMTPPCTFAPSFDLADSTGVSVYTAAESGIALMNFHTALDASVEATRTFPRMLSLQFERLLKPLPTDPDKGYAIMCSVRDEDSPFKLAHLAARVTSVFARPPRVWGDFDTTLSSIVIGNGGANAVVNATLDAGADCLVCGEVRYHSALNAAQAGLAIVEIGHDVSEFPLCALLANGAVEAGVAREKITMIDQSSNWAYPDSTRL